MYPSLDEEFDTNLSRISSTQLNYRKTLKPSTQQDRFQNSIQNTLVNLQSFKVSSFKPHLNTHQCYLSLIINQKTSIPLKIVLFRNFPNEAPLIFVTKWIVSPIVNSITCQVNYEKIYSWKTKSSLNDLLKALQEYFARTPFTQQSEVDINIRKVQQYQKELQSLRGKPFGTQAPLIPQLNLENTLKTFQYQETLASQLQNQNQLYMLAAQQYSDNISRLKCVGQRFSKGKILREMEKKTQQQLQRDQGGKIQDQLAKYFQNRKKYHRIKLLKERYLQSS